jgi:hypothetical protein
MFWDEPTEGDVHPAEDFVDRWIEERVPSEDERGRGSEPLHVELVIAPGDVVGHTMRDMQTYQSNAQWFLEELEERQRLGELTYSVVCPHPHAFVGKDFVDKCFEEDRFHSRLREIMAERPVHQKLYNPLEATIGDVIHLGEAEFADMEWEVAEVHQSEIGEENGIARFVDYHIRANSQPDHERADEDGNIDLVLRINQPSHPIEPATAFIFQVEKAHSYEPDFAASLRSGEGVQFLSEDGEIERTYFIRHDAESPYEATRIICDEPGFDATGFSAYAITNPLEYWVGVTEVEEGGGERYDEIMVVEVDVDNGWMESLVGWEIDYGEVTVAKRVNEDLEIRPGSGASPDLRRRVLNMGSIRDPA